MKNLQLDNVSVDFINNEFRPAIICIDVNGLEIDRFKAKVADGIRVAKFVVVKNLVIYRSPVLDKEVKRSK